jgi:SAM-dependent methyltransferase
MSRVTLLSEHAWTILRCSSCSAPLAPEAAGARCAACGTHYPRGEGGALDLRLQRPKRATVDYEVGMPLATDGVDFEPLPRRPDAPVSFDGIDVPHHLTPELLSHFPKAAPGSLALDLGCGTGIHRAVCEHAGFEWIGVDWDKRGAPLWGDGHALPFADEAFDFVLSIAVLEHIRYPPVMLREALRVLRPGGTFIGTVSFNEPFHENSFYHHTHLGALSALRHAGFDVEAVAPNPAWAVLRAQANMGLFPKLPDAVGRAIVAPVQLLHRLWWRLARLVSGKATEHARVLHLTGSLAFIASKPRHADAG